MRPLLAAALLALPLPALPQSPPVDDFEVEEPSPGIAVGAAPRGRMVAALDAGWLRTGVQGRLGLGYWLDFEFRGDSMLLYRGLNAQNAIALGLRVTPLSDGLFRLSGTFEAGETYVPLGAGSKTSTFLRGELAVGAHLEPVTIYGRLSARGARADSPFEKRWASDTEAGVGVEARLGKRLLLGVEGFGWARPQTTTIFQWRLRVGWII
ncbi:MAG: hypothetical protein U0229_22655 [Anaeromyxobacter sp.]